MNAHRIETAFTEDGKLSLQNLPFKEGDEVEVVILKRNLNEKRTTTTRSLEGTVISYDAPLEPATDTEDWEVLR